jgi:hypothetical protein
MILRFSFGQIDCRDLSEFELGDIEFGNAAKTVSSECRSPSQSMMLFLSVVSLLDGIREFIEQGKDSFLFVGSDSSFSISFRRHNNSIHISVHGELDLTTTESELSGCIYAAALQFYDRYGSTLQDRSAVKGDLEAALEDFKGITPKP